MTSWLTQVDSTRLEWPFESAVGARPCQPCASSCKPTGEGLGQIMGEHLQVYGNLFGSYLAAKG